MKPHTITFILLSACLLAHADTITILPGPPAPGEYLLQIGTAQAFFDSGPQLWCCGEDSWSAETIGGKSLVEALVDEEQIGAITSWDFIACPAAGPCNRVEDVFGPVESPGRASYTPEPGSFLLTALFFLACGGARAARLAKKGCAIECQ